MRVRRRYLAAAFAAAFIAGWTALSPGDHPPVSAAPADPAISDSIDTLLSQVALIDQLPYIPGYDRGCGIDKKTQTREACVFGPAWNDPLNTTPCDTRNRFLHTQLHAIKVKPGTHGCKITAGYLYPDPYTGERTELDDIDLDHIYPLSRAWHAAAWQWGPQQRQIFSNDFAELAATDAGTNRSKSDAGLDWLPQYEPCAYVQRYLTVAVKYRLPITVAEHDTVTARCS